MKWDLLLLIATVAASVEREEPYLGSYQVMISSNVILSLTALSFVRDQ